MATVQENAVPATTRFFCHMCNVEVNIPVTGRSFACSLCGGGFVEELPPNAPTMTHTHVAATGAGGNNSNTTSAGNNLRRLSLTADLANLLRSGAASRNASAAGMPVTAAAGAGNTTGGGRGRAAFLAAATAPAGGRVHAANDRIDNVLMEFLSSLANAEGAAGHALPIGALPTFYLGNLGDYAWGREGIDTIVTQLLNQMETTGPPPLSSEKIAEIPIVPVDATEVETKLQCSVCWEDFKLSEPVRKLPCSHKYHEQCIVPWLKLHGTCPICRKTLNVAAAGGGGGGGEQQQQQRNQQRVHVGSALNFGTATSGHTTAAATSSGTSQQQQQPQPQQSQQAQPQAQSNHVFTFEDLLDDLD